MKIIPFKNYLLFIFFCFLGQSSYALTVLQPNGGETYTTGQIIAINWDKSDAGNNVSIELTTATNVVYWVITDPTSNDGIYNWTIPNSLTPGNYKIKIYETGTGLGVDFSDATFTITDPPANCSDDGVINITEPDVGELLTAGEIFSIHWTGSLKGSDCQVVIAYQVDEGPWMAIDFFTDDDGLYEWTVPENINSTNVDLSIIYTTYTSNGNAIGDILNDFSIQSSPCSHGATINLTEPDSEEILTSGTSFSIRWTGSLKGSACPVVIGYRVNDGNTVIITSSTSDDGAYTWSIPPDINSTNVDLVIAYTTRDANGNAVGDVQSNFTVRPTNNQYTVITPNGGEIYIKGSILPINWSNLGLGGIVSIELTNATNNTQLVIADPTNNDGAFDWQIPNDLPEGDYKIKIYQTGTGARVDYSNITFEITNAKTFIVTSSADLQDSRVGDGVCADSEGNCTLRAAIEEANTSNFKEKIVFVDNVNEITFLTAPPEILDSLLIDGGTTGQVKLNGSATNDPLVIKASNVEIYGLHFSQFQSDALLIGGNNANIKIGKTGKGCVFTQNGFGVFLSDTLNHLTFQGNYFGTTPNFESNLGNSCGLDVSGKIGTQITNVLFGEGFNSTASNFVCNNTGLGLGLMNTQNAVITGNYFGTDNSESKNMGNGIAILLKGGQIGGNASLKNVIAYNGRGIQTIGPDLMVTYNHLYKNDLAILSNNGKSRFSRNVLECNNRLIFGDNNHEPAILSVSIDSIKGTAGAFDTVEVYLSNQMECEHTPCQPNQFLGLAYADINGNWTMVNTFSLQLNDALVAISIDSENNSSHVSTCYYVLPDDCALAQPLPINSAACSSVGIVLDLKQMTNSRPTPLSNCATNYAGNDAWYQLIVPASGNFLLRTKLNNKVVPVIEIYNECGSLALPECEVLDSTPFLMILQDFTPNSTRYIRVWDKNNAVVNSEGAALLHLTAHELVGDQSEWEICDYENIIDKNPTNLVRRDATTFILDYKSDASPTEVATNNETLVASGLNLEKECFCGTQPIQLWSTTNPINMEDRRMAAKRKLRVDTTTYNYLFESTEFQVNSYAIGQQHNTRVDMDKTGNFVMVWKDEQRRHNYGRIYKNSGNPITQEFQIGTSEKTQYATDLAMEENGDFVVVWQEIDQSSNNSAFSIYGKRYDKNGNKKEDIFNITKKAYIGFDDAPNYGLTPRVAVNNTGAFIVTWRVEKQLFAQKFDHTTALSGSLIEVSPPEHNDIGDQLAIALQNNGEFIITWSDTLQQKKDIYAQRFNETGMKIGNTILVNSHLQNNQANPDIAINPDGTFIITWESYHQVHATSNYDIYAQRFDAIGNKIGTEFLVNTYTTNAQRNPSIAAFDNNTFVIAWSSFGQDKFAEGIYATLFSPNGNPIAPIFKDSTRGALGPEFRMNAYEEPQQNYPHLATNGLDLFIGAWEDGYNDGSFEGIFAQRYEVDTIDNKIIFYPIGTATPAKLMGEKLSYPTTYYQSTAKAKK
ncbi:MAG: Ser-Thr-rich GPI-anchored membrane family protein, partial [Saprospiraceae bacterium]